MRIADQGGAGGTRHAKQDPTYKKLILTGTLRATRKQAGATIKQAEALDPELRAIVDTRLVGRDGKILPVRCRQGCQMARDGRDCEHAQTAAWRVLRDSYAEKNRDLARRAAERQWKRNQHLPGEVVACCTEPGAASHHHACFKHGNVVHCSWCHGKQKRLCQPDLEALAFLGLLEAVHKFNPDKAGRISSYAVHLIKQTMMELLRQTPISFPQDLLRDRREIAALEKQHVKAGAAAPTDIEVRAHLLSIRACRRGETIEERITLARNCYYGQERESVEALQSKYIDNNLRFEKRMRRGKLTTAIESLTAELPTETENVLSTRARRALQAALPRLSIEARASAELYLDGKLPSPPASVVLALRAVMDVRMPGVLAV